MRPTYHHHHHNHSTATTASTFNNRSSTNFRPHKPSYNDQRSNYPSNYRRHRPPDPPNFILELRSTKNAVNNHRAAVFSLISQCKSSPENYVVLESGDVIARFFFSQWSCTLDSIVDIWKLRLSESHRFIPKLIANVIVPSDVDELNDRLKPLFSEKLHSLLSCDVVTKWKERFSNCYREIGEVDYAMRKRHVSPLMFERLNQKRKVLASERDLISKRISEFNFAIKCLIRHVDGECEDTEVKKWNVPVFRLGLGFDWSRIYHLMMRECKRLDDGLPIYCFRQEILQHVNSQQIIVLRGETGSGKSTQLAQFLIDSGVVADGSIVCTQPRKIAAVSLAHRVEEESYECYESNAINCHPSYSSAQKFNGKLLYTTDHCLLQHCMHDRNLCGVSCILIDEAHERSLDTDLLLSLLKSLLPPRPDLRLIIMSATADAKQLSDYFFGCRMFTVVGRNFPVDVKYVPCVSQGTLASAGNVAQYVVDALKLVTEIHRTEKEGSILAFLTSALEVEWACERFIAPNAQPLALHGKLSHEEQSRVFLDYPGKRKVIFATNVAETSLTIPGVKYVVDSGRVKESRFEPGSGMNVLRVCWISKSSAKQRAGRAGRTEPGCCYRLYSEDEFHSMSAQQEPEIRRVHLGVAVLKMLALGVKNLRDFDFVDAPNPEAIDMAIRNLIQLGAVALKNGDIELTDDGRYLVKLGMEPRLGKIVLGCLSEQLGKEGIVLAAVMANSSSIFCRVGNFEDKLKSDRLKVPFCHRDGDLFTLLSVYKAWEEVPKEMRNKWCWEHSINAKSMRRCHDTVLELEKCLQYELRIIVPSYWSWKSEATSQYDKNLKKAILSSLSENVAMYSGCDKLGYNVALTGQHIQLHPACSLLMFNHRPEWVVFGEILSVSDQYLVCVTTFDHEFLSTLTLPPLFDASLMESKKLHVITLSGLGRVLLKKFCGKFNSGLLSLTSRIRKLCGDERISIDVDIDNNEMRLFSSPNGMEKVVSLVNEALDCERRWLQSECMEKCLYSGGPGLWPPVALFGSGAEIKHLEVDKRCLTVDVFYPNVSAIDDKELIRFIEKFAPGICAVHKFTAHNHETDGREQWGRVTFLTPDAAEMAVELNGFEFNGSVLNVSVSETAFGVDRGFSVPMIKANLSWPRRFSRGCAIVKCDVRDVYLMVSDFSNLLVGDRYVRCDPSSRYRDSVVVSGLDKEASEPEILSSLRTATNLEIRDLFLIRGEAVENPPCHACEEVLFREISVFLPKGSPQINHCRVRVLNPRPKDAFVKASISFDGRLHLEAARALEHIEGKVLPGFLSWQKIQCQRLFHTSVSCPKFVYEVIKGELHTLISRCRHRLRGGESIDFLEGNGMCRVNISAMATKTVAELRRPIEELMKGRTISHVSLTPAVLQLLFSRDGITLMRSLQQDMKICLIVDRQSVSVRIFGPSNMVIVAEERFIKDLVNLHENKQLEINLRGGTHPYDLMKVIVERFGPNLQGLKEKVPEADFTLNTRRHVISISGTKEAKQKVEQIVNELAEASSSESTNVMLGETTCPICLCEVEDAYQLESCMHLLCRSCLVEQCESAIRNYDSFPICCTHHGCGVPFLIADLRALLPVQKLDELFWSSMRAFVASSRGEFRFCPSPDCPCVYRVTGPTSGGTGSPFICGACYAETCTKCHLEYHPFLSCERYKEFKEDPDSSLKEWCRGKEDAVKKCPVCGYTIEKAEGCNHVECKCGRHLCWVCLEHFTCSDDCYAHLRATHKGIS